MTGYNEAAVPVGGAITEPVFFQDRDRPALLVQEVGSRTANDTSTDDDRPFILVSQRRFPQVTRYCYILLKNGSAFNST